MNWNPVMVMKVMGAKRKFDKNHPKFAAFLKAAGERKMEAGTVVEVTLTRPGEEPLRTNLVVQESDLELAEGLKELMKQHGGQEMAEGADPPQW